MYQLPTWAQNPQTIHHQVNTNTNTKNNDEEEEEEEDYGRWELEEIKNGTVVNNYKLDVPVITFGRTNTGTISPSLVGGGECCENVHYKSILTAHESE